jgi:hypothetical protein
MEVGMKNPHSAARYALDLLQADPYSKADDPYIKPSSLAKGCLLYVAFELRGEPKPPLDARVGRILSVGTEAHRRLQRGLGRACLGQEVFFEVPEYRIHGFCDAILHFPKEQITKEQMTPELVGDRSGFWALEFKTTGSRDFDVIKAAGIPKEEHVRQAQIYLWGLDRHFSGAIQLEGAIIYYENRDTLEHLALEVLPDGEAITNLLSRVKSMLDGLGEGRLPDDFLPPDHWAHRYCPFLEICEPGKKALEWQAQQPKSLPDEVLAGLIAKRIVAKKGAETMTAKKKPGARSLADLANQLDWE